MRPVISHIARNTGHWNCRSAPLRWVHSRRVVDGTELWIPVQVINSRLDWNVSYKVDTATSGWSRGRRLSDCNDTVYKATNWSSYYPRLKIAWLDELRFVIHGDAFNLWLAIDMQIDLPID